MLAACGTPAAPPKAPAKEAGKCVVDPAVSATRRATPEAKGCMSQLEANALAASCEAGDPDGCYLAAVCVLSTQPGADQPEKRAEAVTTVRAATRKACDAGIAEACLMRVGVVTQDGGPQPEDACPDLVRACNLDEKGCFDCRSGDCD